MPEESSQPQSESSALSQYLVPSLLGVVVVATIASAFVWRGFALRLKTDFLPLDRSAVGPNLVAAVVQYVILALALSLFYPPMRKAIGRFMTKHKNDLKAHFSKENELLHAKMDHIIKHHPDIPDFPTPK